MRLGVMKAVGFGSRMEGAMLHKNVEIRANWESVANEGRRNLGLGVEAGCMMEEG